MTPNTLNFEVGWPGKPFFLYHGIKSIILVYDLSRFEIVWILTPNDPKWPLVTFSDLNLHFVNF